MLSRFLEPMNASEMSTGETKKGNNGYGTKIILGCNRGASNSVNIQEYIVGKGAIFKFVGIDLKGRYIRFSKLY